MCTPAIDTGPQEHATPHNLDAERSVLGAILLDNQAIHPAAETLTADDFYGEAHRLIFAAMVALTENAQAIDPVSVAEELGDNLEDGGLGYLSSLTDGLPSPAYRSAHLKHVEHHCRIVKDKATARRLVRLGCDLTTAALRGDDVVDLLATIAATDTGNGGPPEELIRAEVRRQQIRREALRRLDADERGAPMPQELLTLKLRLARPRPAEPVWVVPKWQPAETRVVLAAQFKAGKTVLTANLIRSLLDGDDFLGVATVKPITGTVALLDFEMSEAQLLTWLDDQGIRSTDRLLLVPLRGQAAAFDLLDAGARAAWATLLREHEVSYLILDCLRPILDALGLDEHREAGRFLVALDALLAEAGIPDALVVHHMGHAGERSRGDSRLRDWPDVEWRLVRQGEDSNTTRFITAYGRDVDQPEMQLQFDPSTRHLTAVGGTRREAHAKEALGVVFDVLEKADEPLSGRAVETALGGTCPRDRVRAALKLAVHDGLVSTKRGAHGAKLHQLAVVRGSARPRGASECASAPIEARAHAHSASDEENQPSSRSRALEGRLEI